MRLLTAVSRPRLPLRVAATGAVVPIPCFLVSFTNAVSSSAWPN